VSRKYLNTGLMEDELMVMITLTKEQVDSYNAGEKVLLYDDEWVELKMSKVLSNCYSRRVDGKKFGCYILTENDKIKVNSGEEYLFYNGKTKVYIISGGDLQ